MDSREFGRCLGGGVHCLCRHGRRTRPSTFPHTQDFVVSRLCADRNDKKTLSQEFQEFKEILWKKLNPCPK